VIPAVRFSACNPLILAENVVLLGYNDITLILAYMETTRLLVTYSRVSTAGQNLDRQSHGLGQQQAFDRKYEDKVSGIVPFAERPAGKRLLADCTSGLIGEVHFWDVSRMGRDVLDMTATLHFFVSLGIQVVVHKEGIRLLDDNGKMNPTAQIVLSVMTALASIERTNIRERQLEGIAIAKSKGVYIGRKAGTTESMERFLSKAKNQKIKKMLEEDFHVTHIAKIIGVSPTTVTKVKRAMLAA
jgi:DNA invertase Pin-like site-specific DNA recombinase